jgi:hypothetical protein
MDARASRTPTFGRGLGLPTLFAIIASPGIAHETWIIVAAACGFGLLVTLLNDNWPAFPYHGPGPPGGPVDDQSGSGHHTSRLDSGHGQGHGPGVTAGRALRTCARERAWPTAPGRPLLSGSGGARTVCQGTLASIWRCAEPPPARAGGKALAPRTELLPFPFVQ